MIRWQAHNLGMREARMGLKAPLLDFSPEGILLCKNILLHFIPVHVAKWDGIHYFIYQLDLNTALSNRALSSPCTKSFLLTFNIVIAEQHWCSKTYHRSFTLVKAYIRSIRQYDPSTFRWTGTAHSTIHPAEYGLRVLSSAASLSPQFIISLIQHSSQLTNQMTPVDQDCYNC